MMLIKRCSSVEIKLNTLITETQTYDFELVNVKVNG